MGGDTKDQVSFYSNAENPLFMASHQCSDLKAWIYDVGFVVVGTCAVVNAFGNG